MNERKPHKWAKVIKAWADGADVQFETGSKWRDYDNSDGLPDFDHGKWRIKPKNRVIKTMIAYEIDSFTGWGKIIQDTGVKPNIRFEFDRETNELLKVEMINEQNA